MKPKILFFTLLCFTSCIYAQYEYEPSKINPFGQANPNAPEQILDFEPMIGECDCLSESRNPDGTWGNKTKMKWRFKYIMNGMAIQDETLKEDGKHSGSIRQYNKDSLKWYVHYYASNSVMKTLPSWEGIKHNNKIVLYRDQKAPNGLEGYFRLTFYDISKKGYKWIGEWVDKDEKKVYPTWKIECKKTKN